MLVTKPQKAENADLDKVRFPVICQPKLDGCRGIYITGQFTGRSLKPFGNRYMTEKFSHPALFGLDGEIAYGKITDQDLCRKTTSYCSSHSTYATALPDFYVFDLLTEETAGMPYIDRWRLLQERVAVLKIQFPEFTFLRPMPGAQIVDSLDEVLMFHTQSIANGFEGTIIRYINGSHKNGRSTTTEGSYLRLKEFASEEATIVAFECALTNNNPQVINALGLSERSTRQLNMVSKGMVGSLVLQRANGDIVKCGPGRMSHEERILYFEEPYNLIGRLITFSFFPHGEYKAPRFPTFEGFRADADL